MRVALVQRLASSPDDVGGRIEVGLADLKVDDVHPLGFESPSLGQYLKRGLGA